MINVIVKEEPSPEPEAKGPNYGLIIGLSVAGFIIICLIIFFVWYYLKTKRNKTEIEYKKIIGEDNDDKVIKNINDTISSSQVQEEIRKSDLNEYA